MDACTKYGYTLLVMADHGNSDEMVDKKGKPKTSHSLARVPFAVYNGPEGTEIKDGDFGLANVAATVCKILGFTDWPEQWLEPIIK